MFFKCKMCGGNVEFAPGATVGVCDSCGTRQTLPRLDDEQRANLYDRANHLRRNNDYDKAAALYEQILGGDPTDAEAYWSLVLCRYGIEYVEDPATKKRMPTINRTQFSAVSADENFKCALQYADDAQKELYEAEARQIDEIQKGILAVSQKEEPFDVFICYKETDANGRRTQDSVLAQELYFELKKAGFKVFFSRITLEDKLGTAYEPYIFAALNSAKVMVVLGTRAENFNAVWVKNEWSRYLAQIKNGAEKVLIPAYRDMDPYDLPEAFSHLQAQDMSKLGFMQDLVRGIRKLAKPRQETPVVVQAVPATGDEAPLLKRAFLFLEDGDFENADEYAEKVLDRNPECAEAYVVKLMVELRLKVKEDLPNSERPLADCANYKRAVRFSTPEQAAVLTGYNDAIVGRIEQARKQRVYDEALRRVADSKATSDAMRQSISELQTIAGFADADEQIEKLQACIETRRKEAVYHNALVGVAASDANEQALRKSIHDMESISGFADADQQAAKLRARLEKYLADKAAAAEKARIKAEEARLEARRRAEQQRIRRERQKRIARKAAIIGTPCFIVAVVLVILTFTVFVPTAQYNKAEQLLAAGDYEAAYEEYAKTNGYKDSWQRALDAALCAQRYDAVREIINTEGITEVLIPDGVSSIDDYAFKDCTSLTSITIPDSVTSIGGSAFSGCAGLTSVTIPQGVTSIGDGVFAGCTNIQTATIPTIAIGYIPKNNLQTVVVTGGESISNSAFRDCAGLTSVTIPQGVTSIGGSAFYGCTGLTSIAIPDSVTSIGSCAFYNCTGLTSITIPDSVTSIGNSAFYNCTGLTSITIPDSVTSIGGSAFYGCTGLTSITIPDSVTSIGEYAFYGCTGLKSITFTGIKAQWNAIGKGSYWNTNTGNYTVHCTGGDIT